MSSRTAHLCSTLVALSVFLGVAWSVPAEPPAPAAPSLPAATPVQRPPVVTAKELVKKIADAKGKAVLVSFWATWCPPCVAELPVLSAFYQDNKDKQFVLLSVSVDDPSVMDRYLVPFLEKYPLPFPVLNLSANPEEFEEVFPFPFDGALPSTYAIDASGKPIHRWFEGLTRAELDRVVLPLIPAEDVAPGADQSRGAP